MYKSLLRCCGFLILAIWGHAAGGAFGWGTARQFRRLRLRFPMVSLDFFIDIILPNALWSWGWLRLQQKWVPEMFPGGKGGRSVRLTILPLSCVELLDTWEPHRPGTLKGLSSPVMVLLYLYIRYLVRGSKECVPLSVTGCHFISCVNNRCVSVID